MKNNYAPDYDLRHDNANTAFLIDGYYIPRPGEIPENSFMRAKKELIHHISERIAKIENMTYAEFKMIQKK